MNRNIEELQLIRGFGVLVVMVGHMHNNLITWANPYVRTFYHYFEGTAGLDTFFALSGFVICRLLLNDLGKARDNFHAMQISCVFWLRRGWRLLPAAWLWLVLIMLLTLFANESGAFGSVKHAWGGVLTSFLQVANLKFAHCWTEGYFCGPSFPYWSLSLEEQFYVFLPLIMIFSGKWFVRIMLALLITQFFIPVLTFPAFFRLQGFVLGVLLAIWSTSPTYRIFEPVYLKNSPWARRIVVTILIGLMCTLDQRAIPAFMIFQLGALNGAVLVYLSSFDEGYLWRDGWLKTLGLWLGSRAYAMYLCHIPVYYLSREIAFHILEPGSKLGNQHFVYLVVGAVGLVFLLSELTHILVERPLREKGMRITNEMKKRNEKEYNVGVETSRPLID